MPELLRVGIFAAVSVAVTAAVIAFFRGPIWYTIGPVLVFTAYAVKLKLRTLRDDPRAVMAIIFVVSVVMVLFAWFNRDGAI
jgi:hypothetical protein